VREGACSQEDVVALALEQLDERAKDDHVRRVREVDPDAHGAGSYGAGPAAARAGRSCGARRIAAVPRPLDAVRAPRATETEVRPPQGEESRGPQGNLLTLALRRPHKVAPEAAIFDLNTRFCGVTNWASGDRLTPGVG
jgi:hypothetical protein